LRQAFPDALIVGVDVDAAALVYASRTHPDVRRWLLQAELCRPPLHTPFDLILIRHPDVDRRATQWERAVPVITRHLAPTGVLLLTTYAAAEMAVMTQWLTHLETIPLDVAVLAPVSLHGRDKVARLFRLPTTATAR
jgi:hypothetical protein